MHQAKFGTVGPAVVRNGGHRSCSQQEKKFGTVGPSQFRNLGDMTSPASTDQPFVRASPAGSPRVTTSHAQPRHFNDVGGGRKLSSQVELRRKGYEEAGGSLSRTSSVGQLVNGYETIDRKSRRSGGGGSAMPTVLAKYPAARTSSGGYYQVGSQFESPSSSVIRPNGVASWGFGKVPLCHTVRCVQLVVGSLSLFDLGKRLWRVSAHIIVINQSY